MPTTSFDPNDPRLTAYALGELHGDELAEFEQLLTESSAARDALVEIRETTGWLRNELAAESPLALTVEQHQRLEQHLTSRAGAAENPLAATLVPQVRCEGAASAPPSVTLAPADLRREQARHRWAVLAATAATVALGATVMLWPPSTSRFSNAKSRPMMSEAQLAQVGTRDRIKGVNADISIETRPAEESLEGLVSVRDEMSNESSGGSERSIPRGNQVTNEVDSSTSPPSLEGSKPDATTGAFRIPQDGKDLSGGRGAGGEGQREHLAKGGPQSEKGRFDSGATSKLFVEGKKGDDSRSSGYGEQKGAVGRPLSKEGDSSENKPGNAPHNADPKRGTDLTRPVASPEYARPLSTVVSNPAGAERTARGLNGPGVQLKMPENWRLPQLAAREGEKPNAKFVDSLSVVGERIPNAGDHLGTEAYAAIVENPFLTPVEQPLSTFSVDVDTASYANVRRFLNQGQLPPADAVRIEELVNYFKYDDPAPVDGQPFRVVAEAAPCPWQREHYVARISLKAKEIAKQQRPPTNLVFLLDVSGSMQPDNKLPLVKRAMSLLIEELGERDRVSIVTYAGDAGLKLEPTVGSDQTKIMQAIEALSAGGSTNGAAGIQLAYEQALRHFSKESANRVILCTDGDFNVGVSSDNELVTLIEQQAKSGVFLSIFGFGMGNLKDSKLEKLADKGNGHYGYIDDLNEARKNFNEELMGTLYTVAKDVKLQVEFNPLTVGAYRLIGYENRVMAAEDFNNDAKDAGEIGAGHTVTALYEIVPRGKWKPAQPVDPLKYTATEPAPKAVEQKGNVSPESADDLFTVKLRYKQPDAAASVRTVDVVVDDIVGKKVTPSRDLLWSASVASFGMQLRHSQHAGTWTMADVLETARGAKGDDTTGRRGEFVELVKATMKLMPSPQRDPQSKKPAVGF